MHLLSIGLLSAGFALVTAPFAAAEPLEIAIKPAGRAATGRPLPAGAIPVFTISVRNGGEKATGPVELSVRAELLANEKSEVWQTDGGALKTRIESIAAGATAERTLRLRVETAPIETATARIAAEAKGPDGKTAAVAAELKIADCPGAYRTRLASLRDAIASPVRDAADAMRRIDPALPAGRLFPATGARAGDLARAERLAAVFSVRRGADPQLSTEWFRFLLARWASELNAYASQASNPGLCANNYYQIAGYRQGLMPIAKHIEATRSAASAALESVRKDAGGGEASIDEIARAFAKSAEIEVAGERPNAFEVLAAARAAMGGGKRLDPDTARKFSVLETATWLAEADRRGDKLMQSIEQVLAAIGTAHKETCVCAF